MEDSKLWLEGLDRLVFILYTASFDTWWRLTFRFVQSEGKHIKHIGHEIVSCHLADSVCCKAEFVRLDPGKERCEDFFVSFSLHEICPGYNRRSTRTNPTTCPSPLWYIIDTFILVTFAGYKWHTGRCAVSQDEWLVEVFTGLSLRQIRMRRTAWPHLPVVPVASACVVAEGAPTSRGGGPISKHKRLWVIWQSMCIHRQTCMSYICEPLCLTYAWGWCTHLLWCPST